MTHFTAQMKKCCHKQLADLHKLIHTINRLTCYAKVGKTPADYVLDIVSSIGSTNKVNSLITLRTTYREGS